MAAVTTWCQGVIAASNNQPSVELAQTVMRCFLQHSHASALKAAPARAVKTFKPVLSLVLGDSKKRQVEALFEVQRLCFEISNGEKSKFPSGVHE